MVVQSTEVMLQEQVNSFDSWDYSSVLVTKRGEPMAGHEWFAGIVKIPKTPECGRHLRCRIRKSGAVLWLFGT
jgi:hypothetical protein